MAIDYEPQNDCIQKCSNELGTFFSQENNLF